MRFGLSALKGVGQGVIDSIIEEREKNGLFTDFVDFITRCSTVLNLRLVEGLIYSGAFDEMGIARSRLAQVYEPLCNRAKAISKQKSSAQMSLFGDIIQDEKIEVNYPDIAEFELNEKLAREKEVLGVYVSGHPFEKYVNSFPDCTFNCSLLDDYVEDEEGNRTYNSIQDGMHITMAGIISSYRRTTTKRTGAFMAFFNLEDVYGALECVCFPAVYEKVKPYIENDKIVKISAKLDVDAERGISCIVNELTEIDTGANTESPRGADVVSENSATLWIKASALDDEKFEELINILTNYEGNTACRIVRDDKRYKLPQGVNYCRGLLAELYSLLEQTDVKYVE